MGIEPSPANISDRLAWPRARLLDSFDFISTQTSHCGEIMRAQKLSDKDSIERVRRTEGCLAILLRLGIPWLGNTKETLTPIEDSEKWCTFGEGSDR